MKFSELIEKERDKMGLNKAQMANLLGMSERMYGYYQKGDYDGQPNRVEKYLKKLAESKGENVTPYNKTSDRNNLTIVPLKAFAGFANGYENKAFMDTSDYQILHL